MQMVVFIATQNSHSGFSTYRVKSVGKHMGTAGLNIRKKSQQLNTVTSMLCVSVNLSLFWSCLGRKGKETSQQHTREIRGLVSWILFSYPLYAWVTCLIDVGTFRPNDALSPNISAKQYLYKHILIYLYINCMLSICDKKRSVEFSVHYVDYMNNDFLGKQSSCISHVALCKVV